MKILLLIFLATFTENLLIRNTDSLSYFEHNSKKIKLSSELLKDINNKQLTKSQKNNQQRMLFDFFLSFNKRLPDYSFICRRLYMKYPDVSDFCKKYKNYSYRHSKKMDSKTKETYDNDKSQIYEKHPEILKSKELSLRIFIIFMCIIGALAITGIVIAIIYCIKKDNKKKKKKYYRRWLASSRNLQIGNYFKKLSLKEVKKTISKYGKQRVYDIVSKELKSNKLPLMPRDFFNREYDQLMDVFGSLEGIIEQRVKQNKPYRKLVIKKIRDFALHQYNIDIANHVDELKGIMMRFKKNSFEYLTHLLLGNRLER